METIPCPGCRTALEPSATVCPICLRPRGKVEITRAYAALRAQEDSRKKRPFLIAGRLLAAAAIAGLLFLFREPLRRVVSAATSSASKSMNDLLYPPPPTPVPASSPPPAPAQVSAPPSAFRAAASVPAEPPPAARAAPAAAADAAVAKRPARKRARVEDMTLPAIDADTQWIFYGRAYDLISLQPAANVHLTFSTVPGNRSGGALPTEVSALPVGTHTDEDGRFAAVLRRLSDGSSYEIRVFGAGYAAPVLYESDIPYAALPLGQRKDIAASAATGDVTLPPLTDVEGEPSMRRDVFLAPAR
jgi:hypothetical protein